MSDATPSLIYADTSAVVKLLFAEAESDALRTWLTETSAVLVSSALLEVELARATIRAQAQQRATAPSAAAVEAVLAAVDLIDIDNVQLHAATTMPDSYLRALDAIHLAAALTVRDQLEAVLTYDVRMIQAAEARGLGAISPS